MGWITAAVLYLLGWRIGWGFVVDELERPRTGPRMPLKRGGKWWVTLALAFWPVYGVLSLCAMAHGWFAGDPREVIEVSYEEVRRDAD